MKKTYISVLDLLYKSISVLREKDRLLDIRQYPGMFQRHEIAIEKLPVAIVDDGQSDQENGIRTVQVACRNGIPVLCQVPEFLELELLRQSFFNYTEEELNYLEQIFFWQIRQWCHIKRDYEMSSLMELLEADNLLYEFDLEEDPEAAKRKAQEIYNEKFIFFEEPTKTYEQKHLHTYIAAPQSTLSALRILQETQKEQQHSDNYNRWSLFVPLMAVFFTLEVETSIYKNFTYCDYKKYADLIPSVLLSESELPEPDTIDHSNNVYGFPQSAVYPTMQEGDKYIIMKTLHQILDHMKTNPVEQNISVIQVDQVRRIPTMAVPKVHVLLNRPFLSWEPKEKRRHKQNRDETAV